MMRRCVTLLTVVCVAGILTGCQGNQQVKAEMVTVRDRANVQMDQLKKRNELLNRKLNDMTERVTELQESNERLSSDLANYSGRPEEVKLEIITEVNTRFNGMSRVHDDFVADLNTRFDVKSKEIEADMDEQLAALEETLVEHGAFVQFVSAEQDSMNRVFANRFDSRPWYQSIIGRWDDLEKSRQETP